ncbi:MAG: nucleotidyltransferase domain-containing protein [Thiobacillaceae bacterium]
MRPSLALQTYREAIRQISLRHHVKQVRVFGSVLHGDDPERSDLDLLVEPTPAATLMDIGAIRYALRQLLGITSKLLGD